MDVLRKIVLAFSFLILLTGCQIGYLTSSAYNQSKILRSRKPIEKVLQDPSVPEETKRKLRLVLEVKKFGEEHLGLKSNKSYLTYVNLGRDYVSYVLQVAPFNELKHYEWSFPFVGKMPYKGYFDLESAKAEAANFPKDKWDTYVRGVSAYSTLGWFHDPVLSSMLRSQDHDLVDTIIHETVHANIYIKNAADFNERLAVFLGGEGMKLYYISKEGPESPTVKRVEQEEADDKLFSKFISGELDDLTKWYEVNKSFTPDQKEARLKEIQTRFLTVLKPKLKSDYHDGFAKLKLNNAILLTYKTYFYDLSDFEKVYASKGRNYQSLLEFCKSLEKESNPEAALKAAAASAKPSA
jgi:predicted aminopeptidase